ncbi:MAG: hypothetical protein IPN71_03880 [Fibrobacteres bacterium]|nr:hypothetical protein [Fibrobacterota bacterium]
MEHLVSDAISYIRRKSDLCNPANYYREFSTFEEIPVINRVSIIDKLNFKDPIIRSRILLQTTTLLYWDLQAWLEKTEQQKKENLFVAISYIDPLEELIDYNVAIPRLFVSQKNDLYKFHVSGIQLETLDQALETIVSGILPPSHYITRHETTKWESTNIERFLFFPRDIHTFTFQVISQISSQQKNESETKRET